LREFFLKFGSFLTRTYFLTANLVFTVKLQLQSTLDLRYSDIRADSSDLGGDPYFESLLYLNLNLTPNFQNNIFHTTQSLFFILLRQKVQIINNRYPTTKTQKCRLLKFLRIIEHLTKYEKHPIETANDHNKQQRCTVNVQAKNSSKNCHFHETYMIAFRKQIRISS
jgi:hypothetical protein